VSDTREDIMAQLVTACQTIAGVRVHRNRMDIAEDEAPCLVVREGDEEANEADLHPHGTAPRRVIMRPTVNALVSDTAENVGAAINDLRAAVIYALATDTTLRGMTMDKRGPSYLGMTVQTAPGRKVLAEAVLTFAIGYVLRPDDFAPAGSGSGSA